MCGWRDKKLFTICLKIICNAYLVIFKEYQKKVWDKMLQIKGELYLKWFIENDIENTNMEKVSNHGLEHGKMVVWNYMYPCIYIKKNMEWYSGNNNSDYFSRIILPFYKSLSFQFSLSIPFSFD